MPLATAALFGGAGLVVNQNRHARYCCKLLLDLNQIVAVMNAKSARPFGVARVFVGFVGDDHDALGALGGDLSRDLRDGEAAVIALAAGHCDRVVEQNFVGDVDLAAMAARIASEAGMVIGAVAEILKNVLARGKGRLADPMRALAAHMGDSRASSGPSIAP